MLRIILLGKTLGFLFLAGVDALLFPLRTLGYLFTRNRSRKEIADRLQESGPGHPEEAPAPAPEPGGPKTIFLAVGDVSAEPHAVRLIQEMNRLRPGIRWVGFGGQAMEAAGCRLLFNPVQRALIGFSGMLGQVPSHLGAMYRFLEMIHTDPPDLLVLVDYPGFNLQLARAAKGRVPTIYYICPQLWAWAPWRVRGLRRRIGLALSIFPFETAYLRHRRVEARLVGHPIADHIQGAAPREKPPRENLLVLLPGSRSKEVRHNLPAMLRIAARLREKFPEMKIQLPHERANLLPLIQSICSSSELPVEILEGSIHPALARARLVLVKSGTAVLEVGHHEVPMLVFYKFPGGLRGKFSEWVKANFLNTPYFTSLNLLAGREIVPEFAYADPLREEEIYLKARGLWKDGPERNQCLENLAAVRARYDKPGTAARTAAWLQRELDGPGKKG